MSGNAITGRARLLLHNRRLPELTWSLLPQVWPRACFGYRLKMDDAESRLNAKLLRCSEGTVLLRDIAVELPVARLARFGFGEIGTGAGRLQLHGELDIVGRSVHRVDLEWLVTPESVALNTLFTASGARRDGQHWYLQRSLTHAIGNVVNESK